MSATTKSDLRERRKQYAKEHPEDPRHGTPNFYNNYGCHCPRCRKANTEARAAARDHLKQQARYLAIKAVLAEHVPESSRTCVCGVTTAYPDTIYDHVTRRLMEIPN